MNAEEIINAIDCGECDENYNTHDVIDFARSKGAVIVQRDLDIDKHSGYEVSTTVLKDSTGMPFGIRGVTNLYSDGMYYSDCGECVEAFLMEEVPTVTYRRK